MMAPEKTVEYVLGRLAIMKYPILDYYRSVERPSRIPIYVFAVNDNFRRFNARMTNSTGKGHTPEQAMASGVMEMIERYSCHKYIAFRNDNIAKITCFSRLSENLFTLDTLLSILTESPDARMQTELMDARIAFYRGSTLDGRMVYIPLNLLTFFVTTNGMAAGNSLEEALVHGLCEVIERHCLTVIRLGRIETPVIHPESISNPIAVDLIERLQRDDQRLVIRDFSLGLGLPVIGIIRPVGTDNCLVTAGVATHRDEALIRALTESAQADNEKYHESMAFSKHYFVETAAVPLDSIPCIDDRNDKVELETINSLLEKEHMTAMYVDTTDDELQIPCIIAIIAKAKMDNRTSVTVASHFAVAFIEESLFIEDYDAATRFIMKGMALDPAKEFFMYYKALCHVLHKEYEQALRSLIRLDRTATRLGSYFTQRILAFSTFCLYMTGSETEAETTCNRLILWDSNSEFNWHEGYVQAISGEVRHFRMRVLFPYLERIRVLYEAGDVRKMKETISDLIRLNLYAGRLFNDKYLDALVLMTIEDYQLAEENLIDAKKYLPKEPLYDELITRCRGMVNEKIVYDGNNGVKTI